MLGKKKRTTKIDSLIGQNTEIHGDVIFTGGLVVDGKVKGNVIAGEKGSVLTVSDEGQIEGEVKVPNVSLNGTVVGDVHANERIELLARARVSGNVFYNLIEMAIGAEVNGKLVHRNENEKPALTHMPEKKDEKDAKLNYGNT
jgi:cytoskeletal protein CcmA (bactofilin family)